MKIYPEIKFDNFAKQVEKGLVGGISLKYVADGKEVKNFESNQIVILMQSRNGEISTTQKIEIFKFTFTEFVSQGKNGEVDGAVIVSNKKTFRQSGFFGRIKNWFKEATEQSYILGWLKNGTLFIGDPPPSLLNPGDFAKMLHEYNIKYWELDILRIEESNFFGKWGFMIGSAILIFPFPLFVAISNSNIGRKRDEAVKAAIAAKQKTTFDNIAGIDEAKAEVLEILDFIKFSEEFARYGARTPKGFLFVGPPGCGKTLLAKALAEEAKIPFKAVVPSEFVTVWRASGATSVRAVFQEVRNMAKANGTAAILFIDEIDSLGSRGIDSQLEDKEDSRTITQVLTEMDGFQPNEKIFVIGATNRPEVMDPAIRRPGRFDREIIVPFPDLKGRKEILSVHCRNKPLSPETDLEKVAELTPLGFSGADLANVANEASIRAVRLKKRSIEIDDFEMAIEKVLVGSERKSAIMREEDKIRAAYHEMGHGIMMKFAGCGGFPQKISIIPTTKGVGGFTKAPQKEDKYYYTKKDFLTRIKVLFGGRAAEEIIYGSDEISTGAKEDLQQVAKIVEEMICDFGMASNILGPRTLGLIEGSPYLGKTFRKRNYSEKTAKDVDSAIREILTNCYNETKKILEDYRQYLEKSAQELKKKETLNGEEMETILKEIKEPLGALSLFLL